MPSHNETKRQINELIVYLVKIGLADDQRFAFQREVDANRHHITFTGSEHIQFALKNLSYEEIYQHLVRERAYNVKMLDGALIQMMYMFENGTLKRHRLAFFSAPHLEKFQNDPDIYLQDERYADVVTKNIVPFPIRFDYNNHDGHPRLDHPRSHLTMGQYENCRIPVTAPMAPFWFVDFILRNFYHTAFHRFVGQLPNRSGNFDRSILPGDEAVVHVAIPK